jgi:hypothetical protein
MNPTPSQFKFVFLLAFSACVLATSFAASQVRIRGEFSGSVAATPVDDLPGAVHLVATGTGSVSHLGKATAEVSFPAAVIDLDAGELLLLAHEWTGTITAANGDQIHGTYTLHSDTLPISALGEVEYGADLTVTGGAGRFKNATGQGVAHGIGNLLDSSFVVEISGVISTVGSSK